MSPRGLYDEDGVDGPFDRAMRAAMRDDAKAMLARAAKAKAAITSLGFDAATATAPRNASAPERLFTAHADALSVAGDRFRGRGRVVYEDSVFRAEYEVDHAEHSHREVNEWIEEHPGWVWLAIRNDRVVIGFRVPA